MHVTRVRTDSGFANGPLPGYPPTTMLAGLLFAVDDAEDRPGRLIATLPVGGVTLLEYQARLLMRIGVAQIVVVVGRVTPELTGAIARIGRRTTIDAARNATEAMVKLHPLSRLVMFADGLVTTHDIVARTLDEAAGESGDRLLVIPDTQAPPEFELLGGGVAWGGVASLGLARLGDVAGMPRDYDVQSALIRAVAQGGSALVRIDDDLVPGGHGIERRHAAIEDRERAILAGAVARHRHWFDRFVVAPLTRVLVAPLSRHRVPTPALAGVAAALAVGGVALAAIGHGGGGAIVGVIAIALAMVAAQFAILRDETLIVRAVELGGALVPALIACLIARAVDFDRGGLAAELIAGFAIVLMALAERAGWGRARRGWWARPPALLMVLAPFALLGWPLTGLSIVMTYGGVTLAATIEALRRQA